jgi:hypothetical protein
MKKLLPYAVLTLFLLFLQATSIAQTTAIYKPKGKLSTDTENQNKETDPVFTSATINPAVLKKAGQSGGQQQVSKLEHGMEIITEIVNRFMNNQYDFSLLSSHKYMVNDCLGIKASSGQFKIKFSSPSIEVTNSGHIKIKLEVNKINFSALKVRIKPRAPDFSDPNPCHFSGKFEIGGEATNVSVTFTINLVVSGLEGSSGLCFFAFGAPASIKWNIGGLNLKPHPNALDNVAKEMVEDALNTGLDGLLYTKFIQLSKEVIPEYYQACEGAYNSKSITDKISNASSADEETEKWASKTAPGLSEKTGRLNLIFPKDVEWSVDIYSVANKFITNRSSSNKHSSYSLTPGNYNVKLNTVPVENILIKEGKETRIKAGYLNVTTNEHWELRTEEKKFLTSGNKTVKIALPVGRYLFETDKNSKLIVITDEQEYPIDEETVTKEKWTLKQGIDKRIMGALNFNFPEDAEWTMAIFQLPEREYIRTVSRSEKREELELNSGKFELVLNNVPVKDVPIESSKTTELKYGMLKVNSKSSWSIWDASGKNHFKTENGGKKMVFPAGTYIIKMGGANVKVELKDGETVEL